MNLQFSPTFTRRTRLALALAFFASSGLFYIPAFAAPGAPSPVTQLATSKGAIPYSAPRLNAQVGDFLNNLGAEFKLPTGNNPTAQLWTWSGGSYKAGRMSFWRAALQKSLVTAGYDYHEYDRHEITTNVYASQFGFSEMDESHPKRPFTLSGSEGQYFFTAVNQSNGQVFTGLWLDSERTSTVLLGVAALGVRPAAKAKAPLPGVTGANTILVKDPVDVMKGVALPSAPTFATRTPRPGYATGQVKDLAGRPIVGATISVQASAFGGTYTTVTGKTNAQGVYSVVLPIGACRIDTGFHTLSYNGQSFYLPLRAVDGQQDTFNSKNGHVENFVLQLWGVADAARATDPRDGAAYYGAPIRIQYFTQDLPEGGTLQITLKPQKALLGGAPARTLVVRVPAKKDSSLEDLYINDVPIGRYQMTGEILDEGESLPLKIHKTWDKAAPVETMIVDFKNNTSGYAGANRSGVARFDVVMEP